MADHEHVTDADIAAVLDGTGALCPGCVRILVDQLRAERDRAEAVCLMVGWTGSVLDTQRQKALGQLWSEWAATKPDSFMDPAAHPELSDEEIERLARKRDETRARTLAAIRGEQGGDTDG